MCQISSVTCDMSLFDKLVVLVSERSAITTKKRRRPKTDKEFQTKTHKSKRVFFNTRKTKKNNIKLENLHTEKAESLGVSRSLEKIAYAYTK